MDKNELISVFEKEIQTLQTIKRDGTKTLCGSPDVILLKPDCEYQGIPGRIQIADHRTLHLIWQIGTADGIGEDSTTRKFKIEYDRLNEDEIKKFWLDRINNLNKTPEQVTMADLDKISKELVDSLRVLKLPDKERKKDHENPILENSEDSVDFWTKLCEKTPDNEIWSVINRMAAAEKKAQNGKTKKTEKTQYILNSRKKPTPLKKLDHELIKHFKRDIRNNRKSLLSGEVSVHDQT